MELFKKSVTSIMVVFIPFTYFRSRNFREQKVSRGKRFAKFLASNFANDKMTHVSRGINFRELAGIKHYGGINFREVEI